MGVTTKLKDAQENFLKFCDADTLLVGQSLENDLMALQIIHENIVDTSVLFQSSKGFKNSLKTLACTYLHIEIQKETHDSIEDAKISLALAKLKVEILDNFNFAKFQKNSHLDILEKFFKNSNTILTLDETEYLQPLLKSPIYFDEIKKSGMDEVFNKTLKWLKSKKLENKKAPNMVLSLIREFQQNTTDMSPEDVERDGEERRIGALKKLDEYMGSVVGLAEKTQ